jgi:hypothetical protein
VYCWLSEVEASLNSFSTIHVLTNSMFGQDK